MSFYAKKSVVIGGAKPPHVGSDGCGGNSEANLANPNNEGGNDYRNAYAFIMKAYPVGSY